MKNAKSVRLIVALAALAGASGIAQAQPNPILYLTTAEPYTVNNQNFMRYRYDVLNKDQYPAAFFAPAPNLPPCGTNTNAARAWVDFFDGRTNRRLYGFCSLGSPSNLGQIWFALPVDEVPPSYVYIEITDRQTNTKYRSNLADTVM